jgi:Domain of unknown function (DUF4129)
MKHGVIAILFFLISCPAIASQTQPGAHAAIAYDLKSYLAELDRWSGEAAALKENPEHAAALIKSLPAEWDVNIRGQRFSVPTNWLRRTLDSLNENHWLAGDYSKEMQRRLATMRGEAEAFEQRSTMSQGSAKGKLNAILAQREFQAVKGPTWFDNLRAQMQNWIMDFLEKIFGGLGRHPALGNILLWVAVGAAVFLLMFLLMRYFLKSTESASLDLDTAGAASRTWKDWGRDALAAAGRNDFREAIHMAYWAGIYRMEELGAWQADRARTHREYLRLLAADDAHRSPLAQMTSRFELVWYGGNPASARDFETVIEQLEALGCNLHWRPATANS